MQRSLFFLSLLVGMLILDSCREEPPPQAYNTTEYKIDTWTPGADAFFQAGFKTTERAAVVLGPINETFIINEVHLLFGGEMATETVTIKIYLDEGIANPGSLLYEGNHELTNKENEIQKISIRDKNITLHGGGSFRVAVELKHDGLPCIARENDGTFQNLKNFVYVNNNWTQSKNVGMSDDFVIRATVDTAKQ